MFPSNDLISSFTMGFYLDHKKTVRPAISFQLKDGKIKCFTSLGKQIQCFEFIEKLERKLTNIEMHLFKFEFSNFPKEYLQEYPVKIEDELNQGDDEKSENSEEKFTSQPKKFESVNLLIDKMKDLEFAIKNSCENLQQALKNSKVK
ncbi:hypothetical protein PVAND_001083 [Polypedilum vanderplanki]|uniref:Uncharacterized protein n=1 Tax=Polypedilum vanderplanki TaxID=319348 RepID=A0A9J6BLV3_POLVA|nr:hypothetical protein PVAND_001081 [Polypedilum vanderplanki]KAG5670849.1 hypothetical protein PVAND_001083 [Polypedilum vanderplanki]